MQIVSTNNELLVIDDMYAVSRVVRTDFKTVVGPHESVKVNDNSERLLSFCTPFWLANTSSWFTRLDVHRDKWIFNHGYTRKELDHILVRNYSLVKTCRAFTGTETPVKTDRPMLIASIALTLCFCASGVPQPKV